MQLSPHFTLAELTRSDIAIRYGIDNTPTAEQVENLRQLCLLILEPLRAHFGRPVRVSSGFRCDRVNLLAGGSATGGHKDGKAGDIEIEGVTPRDVCQAVVDLDLPFRQVIYEFGPDGWCHVSVDLSPQPKRQVLSAMKLAGKTIYQPGLIA